MIGHALQVVLHHQAGLYSYTSVYFTVASRFRLGTPDELATTGITDVSLASDSLHRSDIVCC